MKLVIVESPTKAKTISKFLDDDFIVESSFGHIRDLPKSQLGVDVLKNFEPKYLVPIKSKKIVAKLKDLAKRADEVILATDEDREGEAIAWHLQEALGIGAKNNARIVFHEITKDAILAALAHPRHLDLHLVDAQQARRVLDRLVGYELSPFLWKKVAKGLSAGRVQSVAVKMTVIREREILDFKVEEYWSLEARLNSAKDQAKEFTAKLYKVFGKPMDKMAVKNAAEAEEIAEKIRGVVYKVAKIERKSMKKNPPTPFTTSTLQQAANRHLGFSAKQTMMIAQQLYEGIDLPGKGSTGLITYMRTDSLNLSEKFLNDAKKYLQDKLGEKYFLINPRKFKTKAKSAQEAHEAIRPTIVDLEPESLRELLHPTQYRLYKLIWQRALAGQMPEALLDATTIDIDAGKTEYQFRAFGQILRFDGYLKIYPENNNDIALPDVARGEILNLLKLDSLQHFTKPPARYSDAGLVKELEKYGIGRPSTYAPTIATIEARNYVQRDEAKRLRPTEIAFVVIDLLAAHFPSIVDYKFTSEIENDLDNIASGQVPWQPVIADFYKPFKANLEQKQKEVKKEDILPEETTEEKCDKCGLPMIVKTGRYGKFLACSGFPECKNIKNLNGGLGREKSKEQQELEEKYKNAVCEKCGASMVVRTGRFGPFLACSAYPKCKNIKSLDASSNTGITCPVCGQGEIVKKRSRRGVFYACNRYPDCKTSYWSKPTGEKCPECGELLIENKDGQTVCSSKTCGYKV